MFCHFITFIFSSDPFCKHTDEQYHIVCALLLLFGRSSSFCSSAECGNCCYSTGLDSMVDIFAAGCCNLDVAIYPSLDSLFMDQ